MEQNHEELETFIRSWPVTPDGCRGLFIELKNFIQDLDNTRFQFVSRPGVTYSLRCIHVQSSLPLFAMVDVIEDEPRWLSVCFYDEMVADPEKMGNYVPGGLLGEDGRCFDLERKLPEQLAYVLERIRQAHAGAAGSHL
jgi:hypothetical protein